MNKQGDFDVQMLRLMESQLTSSTGESIEFKVLGTDTHHVYRGELAERVKAAIARVIEQERYRMMNKNRRMQ